MDIKIKREIGQRLRKRRMEYDLTQEELSLKVGLETQSYANIEIGQAFFSVEVLINFAETLDLSTDYILYGYVTSDSPLNDTLKNMRPKDLARIEEIIRIYNEAINEREK